MGNVDGAGAAAIAVGAADPEADHRDAEVAAVGHRAAVEGVVADAGVIELIASSFNLYDLIHE